MLKFSGYLFCLIGMALTGCMSPTILNNDQVTHITQQDRSFLSSPVATQGTSITIPSASPEPRNGTPVVNQTSTFIPKETVPTKYDPFPSPMPDKNIIRNCLSVKDFPPIKNNYPLVGSLILDRAPLLPLFRESNPYKLDLSNDQTNYLPQFLIHYPNASLISPDKSKYFVIERSSTDLLNKVVVSTIDQKKLAVADWKNEWGNNARWLDNRKIIVTLPKEPSYEYGTQIVIDPFSNTWQELKPNFSESLNFDTLSVTYNPSLDRVLYLSGNYYILEDTHTHQVLWRKGLSGSAFPILSIDGDTFLLTLGSLDPASHIYFQNDLYQVSKKGEDTPLTHLSMAYPQFQGIYIDAINISPNGRKIALLVSLKNKGNNVVGPILMIYDTDLNQLSDTCLVAVTPFLNWSPDGNQLAFSVPRDIPHFMQTRNSMISQESEVVIINVEEWIAWVIHQDAAVIGWLTK